MYDEDTFNYINISEEWENSDGKNSYCWENQPIILTIDSPQYSLEQLNPDWNNDIFLIDDESMENIVINLKNDGPLSLY